MTRDMEAAKGMLRVAAIGLRKLGEAVAGVLAELEERGAVAQTPVASKEVP
jgi:hypothetical protein